MTNIINNSYTRTFTFGLTACALSEYSGKFIPISLATGVAMAVDRAFDFLSKGVEVKKKDLDETIANLAVPATCITLATHHLLSPKNSSILDISAVILGLIATNSKIIKPAIQFLAPTQSAYNALSSLQKIPILGHAPSLLRGTLKLYTTYVLASLATQSMKSTLEATEILPLSEKIGAATLLGFVALDLYPVFNSVFKEVKNYFTPADTEITIQEKKQSEEVKEETFVDFMPLPSLKVDSSKPTEINSADGHDDEDEVVTDKEDDDEEDLILLKQLNYPHHLTGTRPLNSRYFTHISEDLNSNTREH